MVKTVEELAESIARFVGRKNELDPLSFPGTVAFYVFVDDLMNHLHKVTGINKEKLGYWAEQESNLIA